jgi:HK97 family phage major capsid protein
MNAPISKQIVEKQGELVAARDALVELNAKSIDGADETIAAVEAQINAVNQISKDLDRLVATEAAIQKSVTRATVGAPAVVRSGVKPGASLFAKHAAATFIAATRGQSIESAIAEVCADDANRDAVGFVAKAAQNPAMTTVPAYLGDLLKESMIDFLDKVYEASALGRLAAQSNRFTFDMMRPVHVAYRDPAKGARATPRVEGAPIRVGALAIASAQLTPKHMGVILTATEEMAESSPIGLVGLFERAIVGDTAEAIDTLAFSATAGSASAPAGLAAGLATGNTAASGGTTQLQITADIRARLTAMSTARLGERPVWVMSPERALGLRLALNAVGAPAFPEMSNGTLMGYPVITTNNLASAGDVWLIDGSRVYIALSQPRFMVSREATLHEEDTTPLAIGTAGTPATVAAPVRSLFQTNSLAVRATYSGIDWLAPIAGSVQLVTAAAW